MTSSGIYSFNPAVSGLVMLAYSRIGKRRTQITPEMLADADLESNFVQIGLGVRQPNLWRNQLFERTLEESEPSYDLPSHFIAIRDAFISITSNGVTTDRVVWPLSTMEYDALPVKLQEGPPTCYYINKLMTPTITFWPVPDGAATYVANIRILTQIQDTSLKNGVTLDMPYRALDVFVAGLAHRLSRHHARDLEAARKQDFNEAWADFTSTDVEDNVSILISPDTSGYWR